MILTDYNFRKNNFLKKIKKKLDRSKGGKLHL